LLLAHIEEGLTALHLSARRNEAGIIKLLWVWVVRAQINPNYLKKQLLLSIHNYGYIAGHRAAERGNLELLVTSLSWSIQVELNVDELVLTQFCFLQDFLLVILFMFVLIAIALCRVFYNMHDFFCLSFICGYVSAMFF
jgi:hypothetical protein